MRFSYIIQRMCGWAGFWQIVGASEDDLNSRAAAMAETLRHRGPNDAGVWADPAAGIALGFRRLSIQDTSPAGHQPMISASGRYVLVFNGEVYNFRELRKDRENLGHPFRGHSDTEVMLAAFEQWGIQPAVEKFNGMFAFALWDRTERKLTLCRDRLGIKPLYYGRFGKTLLFASQPKAFFEHPDFSPVVNQSVMYEYVQYNCLSGRDSIFGNVCRVLPGTMLHLRGPDKLAESIDYWNVTQAARRGVECRLDIELPEAADRLEALLGDAVRMRMIADVPVGAFLSGGIDSSAIVALMQKAGGRTKTFTIGFDGEKYDESAHARAIAARLGTEHTEMHATEAEVQAIIPDLADYYDEPFADSSQIPTMLVSRLARGHVTVSLSGDGGDENFGGYERYFAVHKLRRIPVPLRRFAAFTLEDLMHFSVTKLIGYGESRVRRLQAALRERSPASMYDRLLAVCPYPEFMLASSRCQRPTPPHIEGSPTSPTRWMLQDFSQYLPGDLLTKIDRASMSVRSKCACRCWIIASSNLPGSCRRTCGWEECRASGCCGKCFRGMSRRNYGIGRVARVRRADRTMASRRATGMG